MAGKKKKFEYELQKPEVPMANQPGYLLRQAGILYLSDNFNNDTIMPLVKSIQEYNLMSPEDRPKSIRLYINSKGGYINYCWQLIDTMKQSAIPVVTIGTGIVASCGIMTLMAGHKRYICHNAEAMSHQFSGGAQGKEHELFATVKSFEMTKQSIMQHYMKCTGKAERTIKRYLLNQTDVYLTPKECVKFGIVDECVVTY